MEIEQRADDGVGLTTAGSPVEAPMMRAVVQHRWTTHTARCARDQHSLARSNVHDVA